MFRDNEDANEDAKRGRYDLNKHLTLNDWSRGEQWILFPENLNVSNDFTSITFLSIVYFLAKSLTTSCSQAVSTLLFGDGVVSLETFE